MSQQTVCVHVCLLLLAWVIVGVQAQNCSEKCTDCASDTKSNMTDFNSTVCTQQCEQGLNNGTMWKYCREIASWDIARGDIKRGEDEVKNKSSGLKWQYSLAIALGVMCIVFSVFAGMYCYWRKFRRGEGPRRCSYTEQPMAADPV
ncbi:uncharacterized protein LOC144924978 isoform X2 [Branchiostoma floridae x Branchiostoma belcheri]